MTGTCASVRVLGESPLPYLVTGIASLLALAVVVRTIWRNNNNVSRPGSKAVDIILPLYAIPVAYVVVVASAVGFANILGVSPATVPAATIKWFLYRVPSDGLACFLMHNGIGLRALRNAVAFGLVVASVGAFVPLAVFFLAASLQAYAATSVALLALLLLAYAYLALAPAQSLHRRPALVPLAAVNAVVCALLLASHVLLLLGQGLDGCGVEVLGGLCWLVLVSPEPCLSVMGCF